MKYTRIPVLVAAGAMCFGVGVAGVDVISPAEPRGAGVQKDREVRQRGSWPTHLVPDEVPPSLPAQRPARVLPRRVAPSASVVRGRFVSIQVNVDAFGDNILDDAANEPSIAIDATDPDNIAIGWREFPNVLSTNRWAGRAYSDDGGQTWTFPGLLEPDRFASDPVLGSDRQGNFYYYSVQWTAPEYDYLCYMYKSSDSGVTWPQEVYARGGDKPWFTIDQTTGMGSDHIYAAWKREESCCTGTFTRSTDGGSNFLEPIAFPDWRWGTLTVDRDGVLYVAGRFDLPPPDNTCVALLRSFNAQDASQTPFLGAPKVVNLGGLLYRNQEGINPTGLLGQLWIASDHSTGPTHGNLYLLASVRPSPSAATEVMFSRSTDRGVTWSPAYRVNDDPVGSDYQWFGTLSVAPNGRIDAVWNDTRNSVGEDPQSELFYSFSLDGGVTWSDNEPASPAFYNTVGYPGDPRNPGAQDRKLGDYYHMVSENAWANLAYAATFNGEQDVYFLRLTPDCNENGVADHIDITGPTSDDCNGNLTPDTCEDDEDCNENSVQDICDIAGVTSSDCNMNGIPDECDSGASLDECICLAASAPLAAPNAVEAIRYIGFADGNSGLSTALRVTFESLPGALGEYEGMHMWVGEPQEVCENGGQVDPPPGGCGFPGTTFLAATLQCSPYYADWSSFGGPIQVYHEGIVPEAEYAIQAIEEGCNEAIESSYSLALPVTTSIWGDVCAAIPTPPPYGPPDGKINIGDAIAVLNKFQSQPNAPAKVRCDLEPRIPDRKINISDVTMVLEAFGGEPYKWINDGLTRCY